MLAAARAASGARLHLAELDELLHFLAAFEYFKSLLAAYIARLNAGKVAARAHALDKARALYTLGKAADKIYRRLVVCFLNLCLYAHVESTIPYALGGGK